MLIIIYIDGAIIGTTSNACDYNLRNLQVGQSSALILLRLAPLIAPSISSHLCQANNIVPYSLELKVHAFNQSLRYVKNQYQSVLTLDNLNACMAISVTNQTVTNFH